MNALEIKNLSKEYPHFRLDRLNLTLPGGCIMGLVGENGDVYKRQHIIRA